ncbi:MAG: ASKHA domain-containing protein [Desulfatiglandaceae bacterium]
MNSKMHRVVFEPMGLSVQVPEGTTLLEAAVSLKIPIRSDCGGSGLCGKCVVQVDLEDSLSPMSEAEEDLLGEEEQVSGHRLACQAQVLGPVRVAVPRGTLDIGAALGKTDIEAVFELHPMVERMKAGEGDRGSGNEVELPADRAALLTSGVSGRENVGGAVNLNGLRDMAKPDRFRGEMTLVNHSKRGITAALPGIRPRSLGVALDIGTTTIACYLCDMSSAKVIASQASANPQRRFGEDVISRIAFCDSRDSGTEILREAVVEEINGLIAGCIKNADAEMQDVDEVTVVGNTTMQHLFCGIHPHGLGVSPYLPIFAGGLNLPAGESGLSLNPGTNVYIFPVVSGFVGGDTLGAVVAEKPHRSKQTTLIVDIGTNGEVVLGSKDGLWATSCATGPALEGAQLECGMRASPGAVHRVSYDDKSGFDFEIIGGPSEPARGLCGSGVIDAVASMLRGGIMLSSGRLREGEPGVVVDADGIGRSFELVPSRYSSTGRPLFVSLNDIRQIQLAKAALRVGIEALMRRAEVKYIDTLVLTGAFGARFDWSNAIAIGMFPDRSSFGSVRAVENAAGVGAVMALLDGRVREEAESLSRSIKFLELAQEPGFATEYPLYMSFPEP